MIKYLRLGLFVALLGGSSMANAGSNRCFDCQIFWIKNSGSEEYKGTYSIKNVLDEYEAKISALRMHSKSNGNTYIAKCKSKICW